MDTRFTEELYATIRQGAQRSASSVVPLFMEYYKPRTVVDVGCGEGWWGLEFQTQGCTVVGLEASDIQPVIPHLHTDLTANWAFKYDEYDLAVCLEVAEHLDIEYADTLIENLCRTASVVLFSAAIPGQGGIGHLNEQWPDYWVRMFEKHDFTCSGALRWRIWNFDSVENWYRQNLMVCVREPIGTRKLGALWDTPMAPMFSVVHPVLYDARRS